MAQRPPLPREEVLRILARLSPLAVDHRIVLIGGQAVAWWTYFLDVADRSKELEIFTSEDIDFEGAARSAKLAADLIGGEVHFPKPHHITTSTGRSSSTTRMDFSVRSTSSDRRSALTPPTFAPQRFRWLSRTIPAARPRFSSCIRSAAWRAASTTSSTFAAAGTSR